MNNEPSDSKTASDPVLAQHLAMGAQRLLSCAPERLDELEATFGGPGPLGDFDELASWCHENPEQASDLLVALRDALGDAALLAA